MKAKHHLQQMRNGLAGKLDIAIRQMSNTANMIYTIDVFRNLESINEANFLSSSKPTRAMVISQLGSTLLTILIRAKGTVQS